MAKIRGSDFLIVLRGLNAVSRAAANITEAQLKEAWTSSSLRPILNHSITSVVDVTKRTEIREELTEITGRTLAVARGLKEFSSILSQKFVNTGQNIASESSGSDYKKSEMVENFVVNGDQLKVNSNIIDGLQGISKEAQAVDSVAHSQASCEKSIPPKEESIQCNQVVNATTDSPMHSHEVPPIIPQSDLNRNKNLINQLVSLRELGEDSTMTSAVESLHKCEVSSETNSLSPITCQEISSDPIVKSSSTCDSASVDSKLSTENGDVKKPQATVINDELKKENFLELIDQTVITSENTITEHQVTSANTGASSSEINQPTKDPSASNLVDAKAVSLGKECASETLVKTDAPAIEPNQSKEMSGKEGTKEADLEKSESSEMPTQPIIVRKKLPKLSETARENTVPSSRIGRLASYGSLAAGLGFGALAEVTRRSLGFGNKNQDQFQAALDTNNPFLTEANAERIVNTLCKVRGAALKLGQMLSIQDSSLIHPQLLKIFERVRQSADFMPVRQMDKVLVSELGPDWRDKLKQFDERPFAAASVGQVHYGILHDGREIAMKIQYPGVAKGIESDINNLVGVMKVWNILPEGMFINEFVEVAKRELSWEVDYIREAQATKRFGSLLKDNPDYKVPNVIEELCSKQVFTTEFVEGISMEQCMELDQDTRNEVAGKILRLCLTELFDFQYMQTDPNWANFLFNTNTRQLVLLDFGASREYGSQFVSNYIRVLEGAAEGNRQKVLEYSRALGFLTGYESQSMEEAHIDAVMILGEAFRCSGPFDFGQQNTTRRIQKLVPVMLNQRLRAPPEESYSLHRKMSGAFLLSAKLGAKIDCKAFFDDVVARYHARQLVSP